MGDVADKRKASAYADALLAGEELDGQARAKLDPGDGSSRPISAQNSSRNSRES